MSKEQNILNVNKELGKVKNSEIELKICPIEQDPRHKCSIPNSISLAKMSSCIDCQCCYVWKMFFEQHQKDVL
jgi:hypothetical protein